MQRISGGGHKLSKLENRVFQELRAQWKRATEIAVMDPTTLINIENYG